MIKNLVAIEMNADQHNDNDAANLVRNIVSVINIKTQEIINKDHNDSLGTMKTDSLFTTKRLYIAVSNLLSLK